jgi:hypothetical protein
MEWKTIDSAPRDGTPILGYSPEYGQRETRMCKYGESSPGYALWLRGDGPLNCGWEWSEPKANSFHTWKPTHWTQLLAPPGVPA